jgi:DnaK suppressor protein
MSALTEPARMPLELTELAGVTDLDIEQVRSDLATRLAELTERRERVARHTRHRDEPLPPDFADQAVELGNAGTLVALDTELNREIRQIEQALRRIDSGMYGSCARCGSEIGAARLHALPDASLCIECASVAGPGMRPAR